MSDDTPRKRGRRKKDAPSDEARSAKKKAPERTSRAVKRDKTPSRVTEQCGPLLNDEALDEPEWAADLNDQQRAFVQNYVTNGYNATRAYIDAGYAETQAAANACKLKAIEKVSSAIRTLLSESLMSSEELKKRIADDATASLNDFVTVVDGQPVIDWQRAQDSGALRHLRELTIKPTMFGPEIKFKLVDDQRAKDQLVKVLGLNAPQKLHISGDNGGPIDVRAHMDELRNLDPRALAALAADQIRGAADEDDE